MFQVLAPVHTQIELLCRALPGPALKGALAHVTHEQVKLEWRQFFATVEFQRQTATLACRLHAASLSRALFHLRILATACPPVAGRELQTHVADFTDLQRRRHERKTRARPQ